MSYINNKDEKYFSIFMGFFLVCLLVYCVFKQMEEYESQSDPIIKQLRKNFSKFFNQNKKWAGNLQMLNTRNIMNEVNLYKGEKSYTINKQKIYMCLKDENGKYYPLDMLTYVLAHEFAHVLCKSIGHTEEFHAIFDDLLIELDKMGLYDINYEPIMNYCEHDDKS